MCRTCIINLFDDFVSKINKILPFLDEDLRLKIMNAKLHTWSSGTAG
ncbi:hypothetical protein FM107_15935 [Sphingobacterium sp. JB170]|nr:hypothetical protein FM107_15935 [Sphingobacterium sp. JB170]